MRANRSIVGTVGTPHPRAFFFRGYGSLCRPLSRRPRRIYALTCRMIFVQLSMIGSTVSAFSGGSIGTTRVTPHLGKALHPVRIQAQAKRGDLDRSRIAAGLPRHLAELCEDFGNVATRRRDPAVAIADGATRALREGAADMDRRVR